VAPEEIIEALRQKPFEPFRLHVTDGSAYDVRHPDQCLMLRHVAIVPVPPTPVEPLPDRAVKIDVRHIARLESLAAAGPTGNGA
jgi:hypothetical protein